jgi:DNA-directed RNA polymerase specialized sigma24 family protein
MSDKIGIRKRAVDREVPMPVIDPADPELVIRSAPSGNPGPDEEYIGRETEVRRKAALGEVLETLSSEERLMITLRFVDDRSVRDVALAIGHTEKNTYRKLRSLMDRCADMLRSKGIGPDDIA